MRSRLPSTQPGGVTGPTPLQRASRRHRRHTVGLALLAVLSLSAPLAAQCPAIPEDHCACALDITEGWHAFDNTNATADSAGQLCSAGGIPGIDRDFWYRWTAPGPPTQVLEVTVSTCFFGGDPKVAIYSGGNCPTGAPIVWRRVSQRNATSGPQVVEREKDGESLSPPSRAPSRPVTAFPPSHAASASADS